MTDLAAQSAQLIRRMGDKTLTDQQRQETREAMKAVGSELRPFLDSLSRTELTQDERAEFEKAPDGGGKFKVRISGYFAPVRSAYIVFELLKAEPQRSNADLLGWAGDGGDGCMNMLEPDVEKSTWGFSSMTESNEENAAYKAFLENVKLVGEADEKTRWILKMCNDEMERSSASGQAALRKNVEFEENKLRGDISDEEREKT